MYGRNRQSITNIEQELNNIFDKHPNSQINANGEPVVPADSLLDILRSFSELYDGQPLLSDEETAMLQALLAQNPGLEVTPQILLGFIAEKTKHSTPPRSPGANDSFEGNGHDGEDEYDHEEDQRGREDQRGSGHSRSLSNDSDGTSYYPGSRPSSRGPTTPSMKSPLDSDRRQRSRPLAVAPPSSWPKRPTPAGRRKSDAGNKSDSDVSSPQSIMKSFLTSPFRAEHQARGAEALQTTERRTQRRPLHHTETYHLLLVHHQTITPAHRHDLGRVRGTALDRILWTLGMDHRTTTIILSGHGPHLGMGITTSETWPICRTTP